MAAIFLTAVACILLALLRSSWERRQLTAEKYIIRNKHVKQKLRIAFLCDIHDRLTPEGIESIYSIIKASRPDIVLLGGDIFTLGKREWDKAPDTSSAIKLIKKLSAFGPVIYAEGNHELRLRMRFPEEFMDFRKTAWENGALLLIDDHIIFRDIAVYALALSEPYFKARPNILGGIYPMPHDYIIKKIGLPEKNRMNILLVHTPMYLKEAASWGADLVLSGHFHGGTIRLPYLGGLMTPQYRFFVKECAGITKSGDTVMITNRGIGTHSVKIRINDIPEISVIDIEPYG